MENYPTKDEVAKGAETTCQLCETAFRNFNSLVSHLCKKEFHGLTKKQLEGHWVYEEYIKERRPAMLGDGEQDFVGLCCSSTGVVDESKFYCIVCKKSFSKSSCVFHMKRYHATESSTWATVKDSHLLKRKKGDDYETMHLSLTRALLASGYVFDASKAVDTEWSSDAMEKRDGAEGCDGDADPSTSWRRAFVKVDKHGDITDPVEVAWTIPHGGSDVSVAPGWAPPRPKCAPAARAAQQCMPPSSSTALVQQAPHTASSGAPPSPPSSLAVLGADQKSTNILSLLESHLGIGWEHQVPAVKIKDVAYEVELPRAKGDDNAMRAGDWPKKALRFLAMDLANFAAHLVHMKNNQESQVCDHVRGMNRFFSLVEVKQPGGSWADIDTEEVGCNPLLLVGCLQSKVHEQLFNLPLLDHRFSWSFKLLEGVIAFCKWQVHELDDKVVSSKPGAWERHKSAINRLIVILGGGYLLKGRASKDKKTLAKVQEDLIKLKSLPPVADMRAAVEEGFLDLVAIHKRYVGVCAYLPKNVQGLANAAIVGAIWLDMFGGRKMEWEKMSGAQVDKMITDGIDYLVCTEHKTSRTYGSLAKWLTPGVLEAVKIYRQLPRRPHVATFLVPASEGTARVSVPHAFATFCSHKSATLKARPTVNLMRKYFHKKLMEATKDETSLKEMLTVLDGHSVKTIDRHYLLREPTDDVTLAKILVKSVLGEHTAKFPQKCPDDHLSDALVAAFEVAEDAPEVLDQADAEDEELEWWRFGAFCGIPKPLLALTNHQQDELDASDVTCKAEEDGDASDVTCKVEEDAKDTPTPDSSRKRPHDEAQEHQDASAPREKRGKKSIFTAEGKLFIEQCQKNYSDISVAPTLFCKIFLKDGQDAGALPDNATADQIRRVCRTWVAANEKKMERETQDDYGGAAPDAAVIPYHLAARDAAI